RGAVQAKRQAMRIVGEIDRWTRSVPGNILPPEPAASQGRMIFPECNHALKETENVGACPELVPVQPTRFVVLVIRIVVAELRVHKFVSCPQHRGSIRQEQQAAEVLNLFST